MNASQLRPNEFEAALADARGRADTAESIRKATENTNAILGNMIVVLETRVEQLERENETLQGNLAAALKTTPEPNDEAPVLDAIEGVRVLVQELKNDEAKEEKRETREDQTLARIEKLLQQKPAAKTEQPAEITFDIRRNGLGELVQVIARK
jgi:hypothetical protein